MQKYRVYILPLAIVLGLFFHSHIKLLAWFTPYLIFIILFFTYSSLEVKKIRFSFFNLWLILFQILCSIVVYLICRPFNEVFSEGVFITILAPTATSAAVVALMLGANINTVGVYTLFSNFAVALIAPLYFTYMGASSDFSFWQSFGSILAKILPILILPFLLAIFIQKVSPTFNAKIIKIQSISFYLWAMALILVISNVMDFIFEENDFNYIFLLWAFFITLIICVVQFSVGKYIGKRYGDAIAGSQSLGQKNTVLAIWMAQTFLNPMSSIIPAMYVIIQNLFNSYQLWRKEINHRKQPLP